MNEATLTKKIVKALEQEGAWVFKVHGDPMQKRGVPDILGCKPIDLEYVPGGLFFALEIKMPRRRKKVSDLQAKRIKEIRKAGGIAEVVCSVNEALEAVYGHSR